MVPDPDFGSFVEYEAGVSTCPSVLHIPSDLPQGLPSRSQWYDLLCEYLWPDEEGAVTGDLYFDKRGVSSFPISRH